MNTVSADDRKYMKRALQLACCAWGRTAPNPLVGAVVVKNSKIVGEGYHHKAGTPHAEVHALNAAGVRAQGATIYVTLEPCSTYGRTPPCTEAIKKAGIKRVICACEDFNIKHASRGFDILRAAGIEVKVGVCRKEALELNKAFFSLMTRKTPYVILKMAMTLDGRIATAGGDSKWITSAAARQHVQQLRKWCDAIMVGGETVRLDRPGLIVRGEEDWQQPQKLIFTRMSSELLHKEFFPDDPSVRAVAPQNRSEWNSLLLELGARDIGALLIEGGGNLAGAVLQNGVADEVEFHIAPKLLTGKNSRPVVGGSYDPEKLAEALQLEKLKVKRAGCDIIINGKIKKQDRQTLCLQD